jgi:hypothetical protein
MVEEQYIVPYILTLFIIAVKLILGVFLLRRILINRKGEPFRLDFLFSVMILMFGLAVARTCYFIFDFYLTNFDPALFYISPNVWVWKAGNFLSGIGIIFILYVLDKQIYQFRFKGFLSVGFLIIALSQFLYPVSDARSFEIDSMLGVGTILFSLILPITFLILGLKTTGELRRLAFLLCFAIILYAGISQLMNEALLNAIDLAMGPQGRLFVIILVPIGKTFGLLMIAYGATKFKI